MKGDYTLHQPSNFSYSVGDHAQMKGDYTSPKMLILVAPVGDHAQMKGDYTKLIDRCSL